MFHCWRRGSLCGAIVVAVACSPALFAQSSVFAPEFHHFTVNFGGGYTTVHGNLEDDLNNGWNFQAGADFHASRYFSLGGTFMFNGLGVSRKALDALNMPNGTARVYTVTADPKISLPIGRGSFYLLAGGGWMRRTVEFTEPVVAQTIIFDPWWGYFGPALVPANQVIGSVSDDAGVWDVGGGFNFPLPHTRAKLYIEARYFDGLTSDTHTQLVPITIGLRF